MALTQRSVMRVLAIIADNKNLRCTFKESGKGALMTGAGALIGGLICGKNGVALGSLIGGMAAYKMTGEFRSLSDVLLNDFTVEQYERLKKEIIKIANSFHIKDVFKILEYLQSNVKFAEVVLQAVITFVAREFSASITTK